MKTNADFVFCRSLFTGDSERRGMADISSRLQAGPYIRKIWYLPFGICHSARGRRAFTLLELLSVIAVIGILAALLFPGLSAARNSAHRAKTRAQFTQWAVATESFRSEYGYYPAFHSSHLVNPTGQNSDASTLHLFHDILATRHRDGSTLPVYTTSTNSQFPEAQNRKLIKFYAFNESDFTAADSASPNLLCDAFGNTELAVLVDQNLDGMINAADFGSTLPAVNGLTPTSADFPLTGIRAGVIFYAPAPGATSANPSFIFSWK